MPVWKTSNCGWGADPNISDGGLAVIMDCSHFQGLIPKVMLDDLRPDERQALDGHLAECQACAQERDRYLNTFRQLRLAEDVPTTRHFFVYPKESRMNFWNLFRLKALGWQGA